jgi:branched-chain amino acid transport system ATP-binding protein
MVPAEQGSVLEFEGQNILKYSTDKVVSKLGISHVPEGRRIFGNLTVTENLTLACFARKDKDQITKDLKWVFDLFQRLEERRDQLAGTLSGGEQQMLAIARILRTGATLLLLDEITEGLAPVILKSLSEVIHKLREKGFTIILVEQNFHFAAPLADRHYVIEHGKVVQQIDAADLEARKEQLNRHLSV